jgi:GntR family transcriptional regulator/MocR family aminotransferase
MATANPQPEEWANSAVDLLVELDVPSGGGLRARLEESLREAIRSGRLPRGTQLPPTRALARDLGISRGTVLQAYSQLVAEGWLTGRRGSGTVVAVDADAASIAAERREPKPTRWRFDLRPGRPDPSSFPRSAWLRALRRALAVAPDEALGYGSAQGQLALRTELAGYLRRARGVRVTATDLLVTTGFTQSLGLLARTLAAAGVQRVAIEEPSMRLHRSILRAAGHELVLVGVDDDGARVEELEAARGIGAVVLTPNRQHPTGATLGAARRSRLLRWARANAATVVEDDYDGEFRYDGHPIGPLQGLDPGVVAYAGTASKTLAPGVRLGWLALPDSLRERVIAEKERSDWHSSALEQLAFAELLRTSAYDRHIRKMRLRYRRRRDTLVQALTTTNARLRMIGGTAGLNLVLPLPSAEVEADALAAAHAEGIGLGGLTADGYYENDGQAGLIVGYAAAPEHTFQPAIKALATLLRDVAAA